MSFSVLVIPEDPQNNGYILTPLVAAILADAGKPKAKVSVLQSPRPEGYQSAAKLIRSDLLWTKYRHFSLWIFLPDADLGTPASMTELEKHVAARGGTPLLCCAAVPELEIYCCAGRSADLGVSWQEARQHPKFKEDLFEPFLKKFGQPRAAGGGRRELLEASLRNRGLLYQQCPELAALRDRIAPLA